MCILIFLTYYVLEKPTVRVFIDSLHMRFRDHPLAGYIAWGTIGFILMCLYWGGTGRALRETSKPPQPAIKPTITPSPSGEAVKSFPAAPVDKPNAKKRPTKGSGGLEFHEVPPSALGYSKGTVPDAFTIRFGTNSSTFPTARLREQVPFSQMLGIGFPGELPLKIYFDNRGNLRVDATIYQSKGEVAAVIKRSNFAVLNVAWDRNWDETAFEIVDERRIPIFQIERPQWNVLSIRGLFISSNGWTFAIYKRSGISH